MVFVRAGNRLMQFVCALPLLGVLAACGGDGGEAPSTTVQTGMVSGQVVSASNNAAVAGATVITTAGSATSAANGSFTVAAAVGDRAVVHVEATGFAEAFPVARVTEGQTTNLRVRLLPTGVVTPVTIATGGIVTVPNSTARVNLPADGLVPKNGGAAAGTVNVAVTPINPAIDVNLMPGDFNGISSGGGSPAPIESFGALLIDIRDNSGTRYALAAGKTSTIRIPLGTRSLAPPDTIPLFFFDESIGLWKEEGTAILQGTAPNRYYEGTVTHFSYWNADRRSETVFISGCVRDANNQPVPNLLVETNGTNYSGKDFAVTAADGTFRVGMRRDSMATLSAIEFNLQTFTITPVTNVVNVGPSLVDFTVPDCLVKGAIPVTITTSALPGGIVGIAYNQTLAAAGGTPGYVWSLNAGSGPLPVALSLNPSGVISGVTTTVGTTIITVKVTDSVGGTATKQLSLTISPVGAPVAITSPSLLPAGTVGSAYSTTLAASGGNGALSWSFVSGALPGGVMLTSTGQLSGTPTTAGAFSFTIQVQDSGTPQQSNQKQFNLTVNSGPDPGTLTVTGAPANLNIGEAFTPNPQLTRKTQNAATFSIEWQEGSTSPNHLESLLLSGNPTDDLQEITFLFGDRGAAGILFCRSSVNVPSINPCLGLTVNRLAGTATFVNTVLVRDTGPIQSITLNGTLRFTPF
ncbi:MAG: carboxypeptidase regulatory-like domain-containing protein [Nitrospiraceae bacterium]|nr:carboxypeptidase regulatory-like domain-containing protein [Nitrospiraceae bacterium]